MDSRSRQNHRSKKSWVPNVGINPLAPVASFGVEQLLQELCRQASRFWCKRKWTKPNLKHGRFGTQFDQIEPRCAMFKSAQIILF
jgi:hypothetical protein